MIDVGAQMLAINGDQVIPLFNTSDSTAAYYGQDENQPCRAADRLKIKPIHKKKSKEVHKRKKQENVSLNTFKKKYDKYECALRVFDKAQGTLKYYPY